MTGAQDFLFEIGTEELPPLALGELSTSLADGITHGLAECRLGHGAVARFATPRRLAVVVERLVDRQPDQQIKRRGPPVSAAFDSQGQPTRAAKSFADACATSVERLERIREGKGEYLFFSGQQKGEATCGLLPQIVSQALAALPIPKRMRWGAGDAEFVRPVHWIVLMYGASVVPATILGVPAGQPVPRPPISCAAYHYHWRALRLRGCTAPAWTSHRQFCRAARNHSQRRAPNRKPRGPQATAE